ncbi:MAG: BatD family protein [candidate division KSB1 bacterium]|nr:BatD family protein [candidate division KSB1 bacterium]MDZ7334356.1 BatD family protein [candidate division KSB1 bacterium]MDZ7356397.1 BatD family protein [candidate division KSB1 bacterium]MDZ7399295.1 BatD family protein [candidate division KSB1 bacterium]
MGSKMDLRKSLLFGLIWSCAAFAAGLLIAGGRVTIEARVDKNKIKIGDLIRYSIIISHDSDVTIALPELGANLGQFEIRDYNDLTPEKRGGEIVQRREYIISTFDIGEYEIPPVSIRYQLPGDTTWQELATEQIKIVVESLKPSEAGDIRDIKPPLVIERDWKQYIRYAIAAMIVLAIGILSYIVIQRIRQGKGLIPRAEKPPRPPHEVALEALEQLLQASLLQTGEIKQFYIRISEIIRRYIEGRYFIPAIEMTTTQLIDAMIEAEIESEVVQLVEDFLLACDLVKFAKYIPTEAENQRAIAQAFEIVNRTKIVIEEETVAVGDMVAQSTEAAKADEMSHKADAIAEEVK